MKTIQVTSTRVDYHGDIVTICQNLAVNKYGEGLFMRTQDGSWVQLAGHGQFWAKTPKQMMRKLRRRWTDARENIRMVRGSADGWDD